MAAVAPAVFEHSSTSGSSNSTSPSLYSDERLPLADFTPTKPEHFDSDYYSGQALFAGQQQVVPTSTEPDPLSVHKESVRPAEDQNLLGDDRVLCNFMALEDRIQPCRDYFRKTQIEVKEPMRRVLTEWMADVSFSHGIGVHF